MAISHMCVLRGRAEEGHGIQNAVNTSWCVILFVPPLYTVNILQYDAEYYAFMFVCELIHIQPRVLHLMLIACRCGRVGWMSSGHLSNTIERR